MALFSDNAPATAFWQPPRRATGFSRFALSVAGYNPDTGQQNNAGKIMSWIPGLGIAANIYAKRQSKDANLYDINKTITMDTDNRLGKLQTVLGAGIGIAGAVTGNPTMISKGIQETSRGVAGVIGSGGMPEAPQGTTSYLKTNVPKLENGGQINPVDKPYAADDHSEDHYIVNKSTGEIEGEMRNGETVFSQRASKVMDSLIEKGDVKKLGVFVAKERKGHKNPDGSYQLFEGGGTKGEPDPDKKKQIEYRNSLRAQILANDKRTFSTKKEELEIARMRTRLLNELRRTEVAIAAPTPTNVMRTSEIPGGFGGWLVTNGIPETAGQPGPGKPSATKPNTPTTPNVPTPAAPVKPGTQPGAFGSILPTIPPPVTPAQPTPSSPQLQAQSGPFGAILPPKPKEDRYAPAPVTGSVVPPTVTQNDPPVKKPTLRGATGYTVSPTPELVLGEVPQPPKKTGPSDSQIVGLLGKLPAPDAGMTRFTPTSSNKETGIKMADSAGYAMDLIGAGIGAIGASQKLPGYEINPELIRMRMVMADRADEGLTAAEKVSALRLQQNRQQAEVEALRSTVAGGGSSSAMLAGLNNIGERTAAQAEKVGVLDVNLRRQNEDRYMGNLMSQQELNDKLWSRQYNNALQSRNAFTQAMMARIQSSIDRKQYDESYGPGSDYYEAMVKLGVDVDKLKKQADAKTTSLPR